jgi:LysM repeat protein
MKTLFNIISKRHLRHTGSLAITALLTLAMVVAALPQSALAAGSSTVTCGDHYKVKSGDTKGMIADTFGLKWWQIAAANNIAATAKPVVGSKLCIPTKAWAATATHGTMTASAVGKKLTIQMSGFNVRSVWNVRVKDASGGVTDYFKVGRIIVPQNGSVTAIYNLPQDLNKTPSLKVCVTNATSSMSMCTVIKHIV